MKKTFVLTIFISILFACNSSTSTDSSSQTTSVQAPSPEAEKGLALIAKSDYPSCHKVVEASIGPSYEAIAAKYPDNEETIISLAQKIIKGGAGNWGSVPMTPHDDLSPEDAQLMVKYILSLK